ncbi:MAG: hypothetical protein AAF799_21250 [Myxococcota bacterium]
MALGSVTACDPEADEDLADDTVRTANFGANNPFCREFDGEAVYINVLDRPQATAIYTNPGGEVRHADINTAAALGRTLQEFQWTVQCSCFGDESVSFQSEAHGTWIRARGQNIGVRAQAGTTLGPPETFIARPDDGEWSFDSAFDTDQGGAGLLFALPVLALGGSVATNAGAFTLGSDRFRVVHVNP